jgi:hypothetical protein
MTGNHEPVGPDRREHDELVELRAELQRLRRERDDDLRSVGIARAGRGNRLLRRSTSTVLVVLASLLVLAAVPSLYLRAQLLDTDLYVATVAPLASDPALRAEISDRITEQIFAEIDVEGITRDALAELTSSTPRAAETITGLAPVITEQTRALTHSTVSRLVASEQFEELWIEANRHAHERLVRFARGEGDGALSIQENGAVTISTKAIVDRVRTALLEDGVAVAARIPEMDSQLTLFQSPALAEVGRILDALDRVGPLLAGSALVCAAGAVMVAPHGRRLRATRNVGAGVAAAMAVLALGLVIARTLYLDAVPPAALSPAAAAALFDALLTPLRNVVRLVFAGALLTAVVASLAGGRRARRGGETLSRSWARITAGSGKVAAWQRWMGRHRRALRAVLCGAAALILLFWPSPTTAGALWLTALTVAAFVLVGLGARPADDAEPARPATLGSEGG